MFGADLTEKEKEILRKQAEANIKLSLFKQPGFSYFHSMGCFEFFYPVLHDKKLIGCLHIWWNKDKSSGIVQGGNEIKGFWESTWYDEARQKPKVEPFGPSIVDKRKIMQMFHDEEMRRLQKIALHKLQDEKLKELEAPPGILKKYLS